MTWYGPGSGGNDVELLELDEVLELICPLEVEEDELLLLLLPFGKGSFKVHDVKVIMVNSDIVNKTLGFFIL